jgi:hypothetical protein
VTQRKSPDPGNLDIAAEIAALANAPHQAPDMTGDDYGARGVAFDVAELGEDCPIQALGFLKQKFYFLDVAGQLIELNSEMRKGEIIALFGTQVGWVDGRWPQWKKVGERTGEDGKTEPIFEPDRDKGFNQAQVQRGLILACHKKEIFDPKGKVRGRGAHRGEDGELVLHCGDVVLVGGRKGVKGRAKESASWRSGARIGDYVYPTLPKLKRPSEEAGSVNVGRTILECLKTWNWNRKDIAAYLLLCWLAAAMTGGAQRIRPHGWIVGPSGAGKTTLQKFLQELMGDWGVFTEDATEAGVRQLLDQDTLAVMFDEIEAEEDNRDVVMRIVRLARLAYSGASSLRGSSDHQAKQFVARSCFLFSSIHHHELPAQDRNRIAILQLSKFPPRTPQFAVPPQAREWGDQLRRRLIEQWPRFAETLAAYQHEMNAQGYTGREQDTYGTLLACGDLLLHDEIADPYSLADDASRVADLVKALGAVVAAARVEAEDTSERCVKHLASHRLPAAGGQPQETVARWIQKLIIQIHLNNGERMRELRHRLGGHGLRVVQLNKDHEGTQGGLVDAFALQNSEGGRVGLWLAVANKTNKGVQEIFANSMWQGGVWTQSLSLIEGSYANKKSRFGAGGSAEGCVLVPLGEVVDVDQAIEEAERQSGP